MSEFREFMVFELLDSGESQEIDIEMDELGSILNPDQVFVIIREDMRRIFIWKGSRSPVRKRFISSRVAQDLQLRLQRDAGYHRCVIKSIDQGDELVEFLNAFGLESMPITEILEDMRYVRNIEKEGMVYGEVIDDGTEGPSEGTYYSPAFGTFDETKMEETIESPDIESEPSEPASPEPKLEPKPTPVKPKIVKPTPAMTSSAPYSYAAKTKTFSQDEIKEILDEMLKNEVPERYKRQNIIIGNYLYGAISKVSSVLGKDVEEIEWERIKTVPDGAVDLENNKVRVYFDQNRAVVNGLEILIYEGELEGPEKTVKKLAKKEEPKPTPEKKPPKVSEKKEEDISALVEEYEKEFPNRKAYNVKGAYTRNFQAWLEKKKFSKPITIKPAGRSLPKIPKGEN